METVFTNCNIDVIDIPTPDPSMKMKAIIYIDKATGHQYTMPMPEEAAKQIGSRLMGLGKVEVAGATALHALRTQNGGGQG